MRTLGTALVAVALVIVFVGAATAQPYYYYFGERIYLNVEPDQYVALDVESGSTIDSKLAGLGASVIHRSEISGRRLRLFTKPGASVTELRSNHPDILFSPLLITPSGRKAFAGEQIIVRLKEGVSLSELHKLNAKYGVRIVENENTKWLNGDLLLELLPPYRLSSIEVAALYYETGLFEMAAPDFVTDLAFYGAPPNDTYFNNQWYLSKMGASLAWDINKGSSSIVVAVTDEGVSYTHADLDGNIYKNASGQVIGRDFTDQGDGSPAPQGDDAHGTAAAGLIAAETNSGQGVAGVSWYSKIMPVQVGRTRPGYHWTNDSWLELGINYAWQNGAHIISNSWGGGLPNQAITNAINNATTQGRGGLGAVVVFSAGNNSGPVAYPAYLSNVIAVGATDRNDRRWYYSSSGAELDVAAPSGDVNLRGDIWSTDIPGTSGYNGGDSGGNYTGLFGGTSAAAPLVAGTAALVLSRFPALTLAQVRAAIEQTAEKVGGYAYTNGKSLELGYGRINARSAVCYHGICSSAVWGGYCIDAGYTGTFTAKREGGLAPFSYYWQKKTPCLNTLSGTTSDATTMGPPCDTWVYAGNTESINVTASDDYYLRVTVTDGNGFSAQSPSKYVQVEPMCYPGTNAMASGDTVAVPQLHYPGEPTTSSLEANMPTEYALEQNAPNPFSTTTEIQFALPEEAHVRLIVYDLLGREVARLVDATMSAGYQQVTWDASNVPSGVYLYRFEAGTFNQTRRMVLTN